MIQSTIYIYIYIERPTVIQTPFFDCTQPNQTQSVSLVVSRWNKVPFVFWSPQHFIYIYDRIYMIIDAGSRRSNQIVHVCEYRYSMLPVRITVYWNHHDDACRWFWFRSRCLYGVYTDVKQFLVVGRTDMK